jgi:hypothetical protein
VDGSQQRAIQRAEREKIAGRYDRLYAAATLVRGETEGLEDGQRPHCVLVPLHAYDEMIAALDAVDAAIAEEVE